MNTLVHFLHNVVLITLDLRQKRIFAAILAKGEVAEITLVWTMVTWYVFKASLTGWLVSPFLIERHFVIFMTAELVVLQNFISAPFAVVEVAVIARALIKTSWNVHKPEAHITEDVSTADYNSHHSSPFNSHCPVSHDMLPWTSRPTFLLKDLLNPHLSTICAVIKVAVLVTVPVTLLTLRVRSARLTRNKLPVAEKRSPNPVRNHLHWVFLGAEQNRFLPVLILCLQFKVLFFVLEALFSEPQRLGLLWFQWHFERLNTIMSFGFWALYFQVTLLTEQHQVRTFWFKVYFCCCVFDLLATSGWAFKLHTLALMFSPVLICFFITKFVLALCALKHKPVKYILDISSTLAVTKLRSAIRTGLFLRKPVGQTARAKQPFTTVALSWPLHNHQTERTAKVVIHWARSYWVWIQIKLCHFKSWQIGQEVFHCGGWNL